jgi:hypothetical protein
MSAEANSGVDQNGFLDVPAGALIADPAGISGALHEFIGEGAFDRVFRVSSPKDAFYVMKISTPEPPIVRQTNALYP